MRTRASVCTAQGSTNVCVQSFRAAPWPHEACLTALDASCSPRAREKERARASFASIFHAVLRFFASSPVPAPAKRSPSPVISSTSQLGFIAFAVEPYIAPALALVPRSADVHMRPPRSVSFHSARPFLRPRAQRPCSSWPPHAVCRFAHLRCLGAGLMQEEVAVHARTVSLSLHCLSLNRSILRAVVVNINNSFSVLRALSLVVFFLFFVSLCYC